MSAFNQIIDTVTAAGALPTAAAGGAGATVEAQEEATAPVAATVAAAPLQPKSMNVTSSDAVYVPLLALQQLALMMQVVPCPLQ